MADELFDFSLFNTEPEDVDPEAEPDPVAGGEATPPDTATGTPVGGAGTTPQQ